MAKEYQSFFQNGIKQAIIVLYEVLNMKRLAVITLLVFSNAWAELKAFDQKSFDQSLAKSQQTVLMVNTPWCGHCMRQRSVIGGLGEERPYKDIAFYKLPRSGEDKLKADLTKKYVNPFLSKADKNTTCDLSTRSTLVVFNQGKVVACQAFLTNSDKIKTLIKTGL